MMQQGPELESSHGGRQVVPSVRAGEFPSSSKTGKFPSIPDESRTRGFLSGQKKPTGGGLFLARTGIEPATQGFSVLCSTD